MQILIEALLVKFIYSGRMPTFTRQSNRPFTPVVEAKTVGPTELLNLADGPSAETVGRWTSQLPDIAVRERLLSRLPESWGQISKAFAQRTEPGSTWMIAETCRRFFKLDITVSGLLQRMRLSLMKRYSSAH